MRLATYTPNACVTHMQDFEERMLKELAVEQVRHVTEEYQPGSERLEKLYAAIEQANRFESPKDLTFNV